VTHRNYVAVLAVKQSYKSISKLI